MKKKMSFLKLSFKNSPKLNSPGFHLICNGRKKMYISALSFKNFPVYLNFVFTILTRLKHFF